MWSSAFFEFLVINVQGLEFWSRIFCFHMNGVLLCVNYYEVSIMKFYSLWKLEILNVSLVLICVIFFFTMNLTVLLLFLFEVVGIIKRKALIKELAAVYHAECLAYCQELLELQRKCEEVRCNVLFLLFFSLVYLFDTLYLTCLAIIWESSLEREGEWWSCLWYYYYFKSMLTTGFQAWN